MLNKGKINVGVAGASRHISYGDQSPDVDAIPLTWAAGDRRMYVGTSTTILEYLCTAGGTPGTWITISISSGPTGATGPQGATGTAGATGATGPSGAGGNDMLSLPFGGFFTLTTSGGWVGQGVQDISSLPLEYFITSPHTSATNVTMSINIVAMAGFGGGGVKFHVTLNGGTIIASSAAPITSPGTEVLTAVFAPGANKIGLKLENTGDGGATIDVRATSVTYS